MILTILATIPYSKHLPNSRLLMPGGFATGRALIPFSVAFFMGLSSSLLEGTGVEGEVTLPRYAGMVFFMSLFFLIWCLISYKLLPDHDVGAGDAVAEAEEAPAAAAMLSGKKTAPNVAFAISIIGMISPAALARPHTFCPALWRRSSA